MLKWHSMSEKSKTDHHTYWRKRYCTQCLVWSRSLKFLLELVIYNYIIINVFTLSNNTGCTHAPLIIIYVLLWLYLPLEYKKQALLVAVYSQFLLCLHGGVPRKKKSKWLQLIMYSLRLLTCVLRQERKAQAFKIIVYDGIFFSRPDIIVTWI